MILLGRVVWVTGCARRVGRSIVLAAARAGADCVVHYRSSAEEAAQTAREIEALGRRALLVQGDHANEADVARIVDAIGREFGRLDALVNSASTYPREDFERVGRRDFLASIEANLYGPFLCSQRALPLLREAKPGRIVNITDAAVERPYKRHTHYIVAKGGLAALTLALARELAPEVLVNAVAPGPVLEPPDLADRERESILRRTPLGRWGTPEDVAAAVLYLLGADYCAGATIVVDGGRSYG